MQDVPQDVPSPGEKIPPTPQKKLKGGNEMRNRQVKIHCRSKEKALLRKWFVDPDRCLKDLLEWEYTIWSIVQTHSASLV